MFQVLLSTILTDNPEYLNYAIALVFGASILITLVQKLFKVAITLVLIAIAVNYIMPGTLAFLPIK